MHFFQKLIWSPPVCSWSKGLSLPQQKSFQKHFSWPTRSRTKPAVNWSRFHFLITFSWGTMARPLPSPGHSRPLAFFPRQLPPHHHHHHHRGPMVSKELPDEWLNMADSLYISAESFVYLMKSTTLAKHWQVLMSALVKSRPKKHFVWQTRKSDLNMSFFHLVLRNRICIRSHSWCHFQLLYMTKLIPWFMHSETF